MNALTYYVFRKDDQWALAVNDNYLNHSRIVGTKDEAVSLAQNMALDDVNENLPARVLVMGMDGRFEVAWSSEE